MSGRSARAVSASPFNQCSLLADALQNLGQGLWQHKKPEEAIASLQKARSRFKEHNRFSEGVSLPQTLLQQI